MRRALIGVLVASTGLVSGLGAHAQSPDACPVNHDQLVKALKSSVKPSGGPSNGGLDNNEWAVVTSRTGAVCAVAYSGNKPTDQWLASRAIAAEKANTANGLSLDGFAFSTANLYAGAQPGGFLFGAINSNPPDPTLLYAGPASTYGTPRDPFVGRPTGVIVFGGGLELYGGGHAVGGLGASGDTSCADHNIAWRIRHQLKMDHVPGGVSASKNDAIIYDFANGKSRSGYGHPTCGGNEVAIARQIGATAAAAKHK